MIFDTAKIEFVFNQVHKKEKKMPFIEIITDSKSQTQLNKVITKKW